MERGRYPGTLTGTPCALTTGIEELGTGNTDKVVWLVRIRKELEEEGWTICYSDGSGLDDKAAGAYTRKSYLSFHEEITGSEYLGTRATHYDGELSGIAQALEASREVQMLAISTVKKLDTGTAPPRSEIEARILKELCRRSGNQDTCVAWVKGHKGIQGNEEADKLCRESSILGHDSEGVVTPAGLRAWSKRARAEARGGSGEGILGWHRKVVSAYTWCITEKGPQSKWLHKVKKADSPECRCQRHQEQTGRHLVEACSLLTEARGLVEKEEMREWGTRHSRDKKKKKGDVGTEKEKEKEEGERLANFFAAIYDFFVSANAPINASFPAELPARYAIPFVPAFIPAVSASDSNASLAPFVVISDSDASLAANPVVPSSDYSVVSSANFVVPPCIESNP